jgi:UDP-2,3-diacylglucosamine pyrophosphatase LpxH
MEPKTHYRTIWLSDVHLGTKGCQSDVLLDFLKHTDSDYLILVGDIIDFWAMKRKFYWPPAHNTIVQKVLRKARHGTNVIFIPGNHDELLREHVDLNIGGIEIKKNYTHVLADGRQIFCLHGDDFDVVTRYYRWIAVLGDYGYTFLLWLNRQYNNLRAALGKRSWSLSAYIKHKVKEAVNFIGEFEENVVKEAHKLNVDGVLCGHIHHAVIEQKGDVLYLNTGDWVESCTAIVEKVDGQLELVRWNLK